MYGPIPCWEIGDGMARLARGCMPTRDQPDKVANAQISVTARGAGQGIFKYPESVLARAATRRPTHALSSAMIAERRSAVCR
eukprot:5206166-Pleurochrysis_carterae.AAC.1